MIPFQKAPRRLLVDNIIDQFFERVRTGEIGPGTRLPAERELSETFGVSRGVVREAIQALKVQGALTVQPGKGTFASREVADAYMRWSTLRVDVQRNPVLQVFELREALEPYNAQVAAVRRTSSDLKRIDAAVGEMEQYLRSPDTFDFERFAAADRQFHLEIAGATQNPSLSQLLESISSTLADGMRLSGIFGLAWSKALDFHLRIAQAIRDRNPEEASVTMSAHLADVRDDLDRALAHESNEA